MRTEDEQDVFQQIVGAFDEPAFLRRARATRNAWEFLLARAERQRREWLEMPAIRLGRLFMVSASFQNLSRCISDEDQQALHQQMRELQPKMRCRLPVAVRESQVTDELAGLIESYNRFNTRWLDFVHELDVDRVNKLRDGYNKYYVLEKECALMSSRTAEAGFQPLCMARHEDVLEVLPLLSVPELLV